MRWFCMCFSSSRSISDWVSHYFRKQDRFCAVKNFINIYVPLNEVLEFAQNVCQRPHSRDIILQRVMHETLAKEWLGFGWVCKQPSRFDTRSVESVLFSCESGTSDEGNNWEKSFSCDSKLVSEMWVDIKSKLWCGKLLSKSLLSASQTCGYFIASSNFLKNSYNGIQSRPTGWGTTICALFCPFSQNAGGVLSPTIVWSMRSCIADT